MASSFRNRGKQVLSVFLLLTFCFSLCGCENSGTSEIRQRMLAMYGEN